MILKSLKIFSQNVCKNKLLTDTLLENCKDYNILFIQKPPWFILCYIHCISSEEGEKITKAPNYLSWIFFTRNSNNENKYPKVLTHTNIKLIRLCFSLRKDIFNHKDINLIYFFNNSIMYLNNILIITEDLSIRENKWNPSYSYYSHHNDSLKKIADSFNLELLTLVNQVSIQYADNYCNSSLVLDLMFLHSISEELNYYFILSDFQGLSDYTPLLVYITIKEEFILEKKLAIVKNSKEEKIFVNDLITRLENINMTNIHD